MLEVVNTEPLESVVVNTIMLEDSVAAKMVPRVFNVLEVVTRDPASFVVVRTTTVGVPTIAGTWICVVDVMELVTRDPPGFVVVKTTTTGNSKVLVPKTWPAALGTPEADGIEAVDETCAIEILDVVMTDPAAFVVVKIMIAVDASDVEPRVLLAKLPVSMDAEPTGTIPVEPGVAEVAVDAAGAAGTKAVNVLENVNSNPAEFVRVVTKTVVAVLRERLELAEVATRFGTEEPVDSVTEVGKLVDDVTLETSKVADVWTMEPKALVVE